MHVYDLLIVEMFRVELRVDPSTLPSWITLDTLNDNPCVKLVRYPVSCNKGCANLRFTKTSTHPTSPPRNHCDIG